MTAGHSGSPRTAPRSWPTLGLSERMRFAIKVALSLTLAFMIPMALGWPQASTAAITVLIIAATGDMHESMMKGMLRLIGTVLGAVLGLGLIALFAQERLAYLLVTSVVIALLLYSYSAYRGDGTIFMLAAAVTLVLRALLAAVRTPIACDGARRPWPADAH